MTEYVILHPEGDTFELFPALVDRPIMTTKADAPKTVKRLALERAQAALAAQMAELDAEEGVSRTNGLSSIETVAPPEWARPDFSDDPVPVADARVPAPGRHLGADGIWRTELHHTTKSPGPQHVCECNQSFYNAQAFVDHSKSCAVHRRFVAHPSYEPGAFVQGGLEPHPLR